jgi:hypothetical protein
MLPWFGTRVHTYMPPYSLKRHASSVQCTLFISWCWTHSMTLRGHVLTPRRLAFTRAIVLIVFTLEKLSMPTVRPLNITQPAARCRTRSTRLCPVVERVERHHGQAQGHTCIDIGEGPGRRAENGFGRLSIVHCRVIVVGQPPSRTARLATAVVRHGDCQSRYIEQALCAGFSVNCAIDATRTKACSEVWMTATVTWLRRRPFVWNVPYWESSWYMRGEAASYQLCECQRRR